MDRYRNVCVWFMARNCPFPKGWNSWFLTSEPWVIMARNCRFPKVGTHGCHHENLRLPLPGTAGSQRLELLAPNLGTTGCHCKQLSVPKGWNSRLPTWEPQVTIARNCRFPEMNSWFLTCEPQVTIVRNCRPQRLELVVPNLGTIGSIGYHCRQLPVPKAWN